MNTNQESPGMNSWWHSDSPACNWLQKVELEFDIKQKLTTVCTFSHRWWMRHTGKSKRVVISDDMFTKVFMRNRSVYRHVAIPEQFVRVSCEKPWKLKENIEILSLTIFSCCIKFFFILIFTKWHFQCFSWSFSCKNVVPN